MANTEKNKLPPKLIKFIKSKHKDTVDKMLDNGLSYVKIKRYLDSEGFNLSTTYISKYNKFRKGINVEEQNLDKFIKKNTISKVVVEQNINKDSDVTSSDKLKNDLEFLDEVIQTGAQTLRNKLKDGLVEIEIDDVFEAIKIKNTITDGALAGLTNYGIENLTQITEEKYMKLIKHLFRYIPEKEKKKVLKELDMVEEDFYKTTDYYTDYLKSQGFTDKQIKDRIKNEKLD